MQPFVIIATPALYMRGEVTDGLLNVGTREPRQPEVFHEDSTRLASELAPRAIVIVDERTIRAQRSAGFSQFLQDGQILI